MDQDDHQDLRGDDEAPHMFELDGTIVPRCGAAELGQRLRLHGPRPPRWLLIRDNKSSVGRDSVIAIYSSSNPWTTSTRTKTSNTSSSQPPHKPKHHEDPSWPAPEAPWAVKTSSCMTTLSHLRPWRQTATQLLIHWCCCSPLVCHHEHTVGVAALLWFGCHRP
nr:uncharacterized protein LOC109780989 isoform X1 [Aegilops tauschii subsp. strangulata]